MTTIAPRRWVAVLILVLIGGLFAIPIIAMIEFTLRDPTGGHTLAHWSTLLSPSTEATLAPIWEGLANSAQLVVIVVALVLVLLTPTIVLVDLWFPRLRHALEFVCLLPISIPAIVLVVGLAPIYLVIGQWFGTGIWTLGFAYGVTVLPYAYRAIEANVEAIDAKTLSEAARSLGASWPRVLLRVIVPNLRQGMLAGSLISVAVVLGEFTIASLLNRQNLQTALFVVNKQDPYVSIILTLLSLAFAVVVLLAIGGVGRAPRTKSEKRP